MSRELQIARARVESAYALFGSDAEAWSLYQQNCREGLDRLIESARQAEAEDHRDAGHWAFRCRAMCALVMVLDELAWESAHPEAVTTLTQHSG